MLSCKRGITKIFTMQPGNNFTHCYHYLEALKSAVFFETNNLIQCAALLCQQKPVPSSEIAAQITQRLDHQPQFQFCY